MKRLLDKWDSIIFLALMPNLAKAESFDATLENLVTSFTGKILPILALGYVGKNIFAHIQGDPNAKNQTAQVAIAVVALLGINGVWAWLRSQVR